MYDSRYDNYFKKKKENSFVGPQSNVEDLSGPTGEGVAQTDWLGNSNLQQNDNVQGLEGSDMEGRSIAGGQSAGQSAGSGATAAAGTMANGGNKAQALGGGMMAAGTASANPYLMAAGAAVSAYGSIQKGKQQREQNKYLAEVRKYDSRRQAIENMAQIGQGLKA
jgi:hypothetical protein